MDKVMVWIIWIVSSYFVVYEAYFVVGEFW
jgi:hypothetical protein